MEKVVVGRGREGERSEFVERAFEGSESRQVPKRRGVGRGRRVQEQYGRDLRGERRGTSRRHGGKAVPRTEGQKSGKTGRGKPHLQPRTIHASLGRGERDNGAVHGLRAGGARMQTQLLRSAERKHHARERVRGAHPKHANYTSRTHFLEKSNTGEIGGEERQESEREREREGFGFRKDRASPRSRRDLELKPRRGEDSFSEISTPAAADSPPRRGVLLWCIDGIKCVNCGVVLAKSNTAPRSSSSGSKTREREQIREEPTEQWRAGCTSESAGGLC